MKYIPTDRWILPMGIVLSSEDRSEMRLLISSALKEFYTPSALYGKNPIIVNGETELIPEYLQKAVNNQLLMKKIIQDPDRKIITNIDSKEELFDFVKNNLFDLFHYDGRYFVFVYNLLENASKRGKKFEDKAFVKFVEIAAKKGLDIKILEPTLVEDRDGGIDGKFYWDNKMVTIQVKPLIYLDSERKSDISDFQDMYLKAKCKGDIKMLKTDYLILTNRYDTWIFRAKGITVDDETNSFVIPKKNIVE
jgi:hypothetical protein